MSSSNSPCAACKFLRRKCTLECVFAPYFPSDDPHKFVSVHKVFGASNVAKLLNELNVAQRKDAVESLAYEAEARLRDPVYGCVGLISVLQHKLRQVQSDLFNAKKELATYIGPQAMLLPMIQPNHAFMPQQHLGNPSSSNNFMNVMNAPMMGIPTAQTHGAPLVIREPQQQHLHPQQQMYEAQQLAAVVAAREQEMLRVYEAQQQQQRHQHQQQNQELIGFNESGFEGAAGSVTATGFNQMNAATMSPSLALGTFDNRYQIQPQQPEHQHHPLQEQLLFQTQQPPQPQQQQPQQTLQPPQQQRSGSDEGRSTGGLS
ncbi:LOB domain-containing 36 -like protein [Tripterygium wilfordii]|uniref:LOB domain-containing 36 -like protein n=1 Tax=Tripterygium wilfordii TaxID=458696 RepID=A0A7J7E2Q2_TRIWF|nr:LOB domain-containing protein 36-like [Tripterygium wilfordii]XP_038702883.1 LOB domain-containing protein 36-like [Tripterygium wilfordii]KAF5752920.1 LOB domain-containing 36 -like protein [Tripterygium wilfordii]